MRHSYLLQSSKYLSIQNMANRTSQQLILQSPFYIHNRNSQQITLTNKLAQSLSQINILRLSGLFANNREFQNKGYNHIKTNHNSYIFVAIHGLPSFKDQFDFLDLPGGLMHVYPVGFQHSKCQNQDVFKTMKNAPFHLQAQNLYNKLNNNQNRQKNIIFVFHSFGTFILTTYLAIYGHSRVVGLIDIGGVPISSYFLLRNYLQICQYLDLQHINSNKKKIYQKYLQFQKSYKQQIDNNIKKKIINQKEISPLGNLTFHQLLYFLSSFCSDYTQSIFYNNRKWPKVLKLFIYGKYDNIFQEDNLNSKAIYYSYIDKLQIRYEQFMNKKFIEKYKLNTNFVKQISPRFILQIQGKHSIHLQKKHKNIIKLAVQQYLDFIGQWELFQLNK